MTWRDDLKAKAKLATKGRWGAADAQFITTDFCTDPNEGLYVAEVHCQRGRPEDHVYIAACSPNRIVALVDVAEAAKRLNDNLNEFGEVTDEIFSNQLYDALTHLDTLEER